MTRPIIKEDIGKVEKLIAQVVGYRGELQIERMGGLTNHSYKAMLDSGELYAVRIPGEGTEDMINRGNEQVSTRLACSLGIDAKLLYFGKDGSKVTEYICDAETMTPENMRQPEHILQVAEIYRRLHGCGKNTGVPFEVFDMAADYERIIAKKKVKQFEDYPGVRASVMACKEKIDSLCHPQKVPCHNDPLCANWVQGTDQMYLIDWEYAGMNDGMWDLSDISIEAEYTKKEDELLLKEYFQEDNLDSLLWKHFIANKIYVDFLWTLWAETRVPYDGKEMEDWATERYQRLKRNLAVYQSV